MIEETKSVMAIAVRYVGWLLVGHVALIIFVGVLGMFLPSQWMGPVSWLLLWAVPLGIGVLLGHRSGRRGVLTTSAGLGGAFGFAVYSMLVGLVRVATGDMALIEGVAQALVVAFAGGLASTVGNILGRRSGKKPNGG